MIRISRLALVGLVIGAIAGSSSVARAQGNVKRGSEVWKSRSCDGCHSIGKGRRAGPDLLGVTDRRSEAWLRKWLHDPPAMLDSGDSTAQALLAEAKGVRMANLHLSDSDISALLSYIQDESRKVGATAKKG